MQYTRNFNFTTGTPIVADNVDQEFDSIRGVINGNIDNDNLKDASVTNAKITSKAVTMNKVDNPYKFRVYQNGNTAFSDGVLNIVHFDTESYDTNNNFDVGTHFYTVPVSGYYQMNASCRVSGATGGMWSASFVIALWVSDTASGTYLSYNDMTWYPDGRANGVTLKLAELIHFNAGDRVACYANVDAYTSGAGAWTIHGPSYYTNFSGYLVSQD